MRFRQLPWGICVLVLCLPATASPEVHSEPSQSEPSPLGTEGALLTSARDQVVKVPLKHTQVHIRVLGSLAETTVVQHFQNPYRHPIEAVYLFPLPTDAAVRAFSLTHGGRRLVGRLLRRGEATAVYKRAKASGQLAALLTQERPNIFSQQVANLEPGQDVQVELRYQQALLHEGGRYEVVFPMVVGPRFVPRGTDKGKPVLLSPPVLAPGLRSAHDIDLVVELRTGLPLVEVTSPSHQIFVLPLGPSVMQVHLAREDRIPNKDFILRFALHGPTPRAALITEPDPGASGSGTFMLMVEPPAIGAAVPSQPREVIFVLDTSSSMNGLPMARARHLVRRCLSALGPDDTFQIVRFAEGTGTLGPALIANRPHNLALAHAWLDRLKPAGGTLVTQGLDAALALPHDPTRLRLLLFVSDGYVGNESEVLALLDKRLGSARLFAFGVGSAVNRYLLEEMALLGRGTMQVIGLGSDASLEAEVARFLGRIDRPIFTDLSLALHGLTVKDMVPRRLPDLFDGQPLFVFGRYQIGRYQDQGQPRATLRGQRQGRAEQMDLAIDRSVAQPPSQDERPGNERPRFIIAAAWARHRIAELERTLIHVQDPSLDARITELALSHGLLSRFTAFVAVDPDAAPVQGQSVTVTVPVDRPQGLMQAINEGGYGIGLTGSGGGGGGVGYGTIGLGAAPLVGHAGVTAYKAAPADSVPPIAAPQIKLGQAVLSGYMGKDTIRRLISQKQNQVRHLYEEALKSRPDLEGRVVLRLSIAEDGTVTAALISASSLSCPEVEQGLVKLAMTWVFPAVQEGGEVEVSYPFVFKRTNEKPAKAPILDEEL